MCVGVRVRCRLLVLVRFFRFSALYSGRASDVPLRADLVYGRAPKSASLGSCEIYSLARRGG